MTWYWIQLLANLKMFVFLQQCGCVSLLFPVCFMTYKYRLSTPDENLASELRRTMEDLQLILNTWCENKCKIFQYFFNMECWNILDILNKVYNKINYTFVMWVPENWKWQRAHILFLWGSAVLEWSEVLRTWTPSAGYMCTKQAHKNR